MRMLNADNFSLKDVHRLLQLERRYYHSFTPLLTLEHLTETEKRDLEKIRNMFCDYYSENQISEGEIKFLILSPLLWLAGFYQSRMKINMAENVTTINIKDKNAIVKGSMDVVVINHVDTEKNSNPFWILLIESTNSMINAAEGLPQLLTYAYKSLEHQTSVWGLTTNGMDYQFVYLQQGESATYHLFPKLDITRPQHAIRLLEVLKAIANLESIPS